MSDDALVFVALGGLGEIGMNAALYGVGPKKGRKWLLVDLGIGFAGEDLPGIDLVFPDLRFIEERRRDLVGIVITHAHEDHIGALAELWPRLKVPVYATKFAAGLLTARRLSEPGAPKIPLTIVAQGSRVEIGPFDVEFVPVAHSIPESNALAIRTRHGTVLHTGDWKIDPTPRAGLPTDETRLHEIGDEGVLALVADSTNAIREGISPSEADVATTIRQLVATAPGRVAVTTFASNVARIRAVAEAAQANGREIVAVGRAMEKVIQVARETGHLDGVPEIRSPETYGHLPRNKVVALLSGSQGEYRAALARVAEGSHRNISLAAGDRVILSSRAIPGNEKAVGRIVNLLVRQGVEVVTDRTHLVHVSGHPRREEMKAMYAWTRPRIAIPVHGEALHLAEHAALARAAQVPTVLVATDGDIVHLAPDPPGLDGKAATGRLCKDGDVLVGADDAAIGDRRRLSLNGIVSIAIAIDETGEVAGGPEFLLAGIPARTRDGGGMEGIVEDEVERVLDGLSRVKRRDPDLVENAVERAVRSVIQNAWGKRPQVHVNVVVV